MGLRDEFQALSRPAIRERIAGFVYHEWQVKKAGKKLVADSV